jgi:hypothetical protein
MISAMRNGLCIFKLNIMDRAVKEIPLRWSRAFWYCPAHINIINFIILFYLNKIDG